MNGYRRDGPRKEAVRFPEAVTSSVRRYRGRAGPGRALGLLAVAFLILLAIPAAGAAQSPHSCASATERCEGEIRVPLDWSDPGADSLTIAFVWLPRGDASRPAAGTILANFGGPSEAIPTLPLFQQILGPVLERHNLLVVDPRGLGRSSPLRCDGLVLDDDASIVSCAESLGPRVQFFASDQVAHDMDTVRAALGVERVVFYGNSYGSVFGHAYATRFPDRLAAIFFDSVVLTDEEGYPPMHRRVRLDVVELVCSPSPACRARHADPAATIEQLIAELRSHPDPAVPIVSILPLLQGANAIAIRETVAAAAAYLEGDRRPLHRLTSGYNPAAPGSEAEPGAAGPLAIYCADVRFAYDRAAPPTERRRQLERYYEEERPLAPFEVSDIDGMIDWAPWCANWPTPRESPPVLVGARYPAVPVLIAAGDFDATPPAEAARLVELFPRASLLSVRFGGHALALGSPLAGGDCVREAVRRFITGPRHPASLPGDPDGCSAETFRALGAFPRTLAELPPAQGEELTDTGRRLVTGAFATAADLVARFNPNHRARPSPPVPLRGGEATWDAGTRTLTLDAARYVDDLAVSGTVHLSPDHIVTADLRGTYGEAERFEVRIRWHAFVPEDATEVAGHLEGRPFRARVPGW